MYILGISSFYHDSAASLINNGEIIAAAQEERFTRKKHDQSFPFHAIKFCLEEAGINASEIKNVVFYEKPFLKFERLIETYLAFAPMGFRSFALSIPIWIKEKLFQKSLIIKELERTLGNHIDWKQRVLFSEHHLSHAASAFFPSPFEDAAILTLDGVGEWTTASLALGHKNKINVIKEIHFPHSIGLLYSAFTYYAGFKVNSGEYKVMGLAPYGEPIYKDLIKNHLIDIKDDGSFKMDMTYFNYCTGLTMTNKKFHNLFGGPPREPETPLTQKEMDIAASIQNVTEEIIIKLAKNIAKETKAKHLCLAGGVALNCVANGLLEKEEIFYEIWIQPAAGDAGGSLGAALAAWYLFYNQPRASNITSDLMRGSYLGPSFSNDEIESTLLKHGAIINSFPYTELIDKTAKEISLGKAVGWMQGRMEFGPRALGGRSIIADPRSQSMQKQLNLKVKFRESFRPFAPSILSEYISEWFKFTKISPYMLMVAEINDDKKIFINKTDNNLFGIDKLNIPRSSVPAITHIDYSSRLQTVHKETNPLYHSLIQRFYELTGCPILVNTSFNIRGEPIVCNPLDAFKCFMGTDLDVLVIGRYILYKEEQNQDLKENYIEQYELD